MISVNIHEAKTRLSELIELMEKGETVVICKRNVPVAELGRPGDKKKKRLLGMARGSLKISEKKFNELFLTPMSSKELAIWENGLEGDPLRKL